ncbi:GPI transamidase component PIG-T isoform X1 [Eutrema salsugineum]|uniref:GPI transamidase component PIG-T isoform X1 n=1 Tax=Eutrema salsugineum TaxID=72664 RepID=UPI000CED7B61|nr:GPI transamidase component PIG-T isoform X1 [Eutrema salsugineum]XP_024015471.1 GPI transamidase component PIG-T isoform X1 [Eutrema salsugineum]XP_024015472.1 GPI transamidase component PIG-T isoform X1 [Eutrema salsugineum]
MARLILTWISLLILQSYLIPIAFGSKEVEEFSEALLLKPLPDRKVLAHFHFENRAPPSNSHGRHHHLFPKAISQLVQKFRVKEMELSFTQGRWNHEQWGGFDPLSSMNAKPVGVELWAVFDVPHSEVDTSWKNLTHALSGLFCASINFLESSTSYATPTWGFGPNSDKLRYGSLPREAVCTENLTPWLKLLPCRDKDGISALMNRPSVYRGFYHSQRLHLSTVESGQEGLASGIVLEQTLTVVLQPETLFVGTNIQPTWSINSLFGRKVVGRCVLAKSSNVYLQMEGLSGHESKNMDTEMEAHELWKNADFELSLKPDRILREINSFLFIFDIDISSDSEPFDLGLTWKLPVKWSCQQAPLHASRFLMGSGNERGAIAILLKATDSQDKLSGSDLTNGCCTLKANIFQIFPWYIKVYYHTLQIFVDQQEKTGMEVLKKINVSPSTDKMSSGMMEMMLELPCQVKSAAISIEYDKGFLHIDEYPPDANQGFDIPSALISFPDHHASLDFKEELSKSPLFSKLKEKSLVRSYTEVLLVPLTTPDFSMPYNVITITCTVFALYFGSLLNVLRRRIGEEERFLKSQAGKKTGGLKKMLSRLVAKIRGRPIEEPSSSTESPEARSSVFSSKLFFKFILVAGAAAAWQYFSTDK